jgi:hypothetical protein
MESFHTSTRQNVKNGALAFRPFHSNQHAYQAGKSMEMTLHQLVVQVEKALDQQNISLVAFLDQTCCTYNE